MLLIILVYIFFIPFIIVLFLWFMFMIMQWLFFFLRLNTNVELYTSLRRATEESDVAPLTSVDEHVSRLFLFDFEQSGIHLPENLRESIVGLNDRILRLGQRFAMNSHEPRRIPKHLLPPYLANK